MRGRPVYALIATPHHGWRFRADIPEAERPAWRLRGTLGDVYQRDPKVIPVEIWRDVLDEHDKPTGRLMRDCARPLGEIAADLVAELRADPSLDVDGMESPPHVPPWLDRDALWPEKVRWIACYAVTGGSEGHWIHIDAVSQADSKVANESRLLLLGKTFQGMDHAQRIAARCAVLLGA